MIGKENAMMGRGKAFNHKKKSNPNSLPEQNMVESKEHSRQFEQQEDIVTHEAFKNRPKADEMP